MRCIPTKALRAFQEPVASGSQGKEVVLVNPVQISRNVEEGLDYLPWWRSLVSSLYFLQFQKSQKDGTEFALPSSEQDPLVINLFMFKAYGVCSDARLTKAIQWCERNHRFSPKNIAKINAMIVAGCSDQEIAEKFFTSPAYIAIYTKLFFDIRGCLSSSLWMDTFIKPENPDVISDKNDLEEIIWLSFGFHKGAALLDVMLSGRVAYLPAEEADEFWQIARSTVTAQGVIHALGNLFENICGRSTEWERSLAIRNAEAEKLLREKDLPSSASWGDWFDEAMGADIFSSDVTVGIRNGERAFLELTKVAASSSSSGEKRVAVSKMTIAKSLLPSASKRL